MNRLLHLLALVALIGSAGVPMGLQACVYTAILKPVSEYPPPEGMIDPAAMARWKAERAAFASAYEMVEQERQVRERSAELKAYAAEVEMMNVAALAEDLAINLTPPMTVALAIKSDCDDISGPQVLDPAGYWWANNFASIAIGAGYLDDAADARFTPRRWSRIATPPLNQEPCLTEARTAVSAQLARRFSRRELASALFLLRENDFDRVITDRTMTTGGAIHDRRSNDFRLLAFQEGRSGALEFSEQARPNWWGGGRDAYYQMRNRQLDEVTAFFKTNLLGKALVFETGAVVAKGSELCPQATRLQDAFWKDLRDETYAIKDRRTKLRQND